MTKNVNGKRKDVKFVIADDSSPEAEDQMPKSPANVKKDVSKIFARYVKILFIIKHFSFFFLEKKKKGKISFFFFSQFKYTVYV